MYVLEGEGRMVRLFGQIIVVDFLVVFFSADAIAQPTQREIAKRLETQEDLCEAIRAKYERTAVPPTREMISTIKEARGRIGDPDYLSYVGSPYHGRMVFTWKNGMEKLTIDSDTDGGVTSYDGIFVRYLDSSQRSGYIGTTKSSHLHDDGSRLTPLTFLFRYGNESFAERVAGGLDFQILEEGEVTFRDPFEPESLRFKLKFDDQSRLIQRTVMRCMGRKVDSDERVVERYSFNDYREFRHSSGPSIWFPLKCVVDRICGTTPLGLEAIWKTDVVIVDQIEFEPSISDEEFRVVFPRDAMVRDDVNGQGTIQAHKHRNIEVTE